MVTTAYSDVDSGAPAVHALATAQRTAAVLADEAARQAFDTRLTLLLNQYVLAIERSRQLPLFSLRGFWRFWLKSIRWVLALYGLVPALLWDFSGRLLLNLFRREALAPLYRPLIRWLVAPFKAVYEGDMSAVQFLTVRPVARLLLYYRLSRRLQRLAGFLKQRRVDLFIQTQGGGDAQWFSDRLAVLNDCRDGFGRRLGYAAVASMLGSLGFVSALYKLVKHALPGLDAAASHFLSSLKLLPDSVTSFALVMAATAGSAIAVELVLLAAIYLIWTMVTNWIEVRRVVDEAALRPAEQALFRSIELERPEEIDLDLLGFTLVFGLSFVVSIVDSSERDMAGYLVGGLYAAAPLLALYRRARLRASAERASLAEQRDAAAPDVRVA